MSEKKVLHASAVKESGWWEISIPELGQVTATRRRRQVPYYAQSLAAAILDVDENDVAVKVSFQNS